MSQPILEQIHNFAEWQGILRDWPPHSVITLALSAMPPEKFPATVQIHFWNAVIDYLLSAAFLAPDFTMEQREVHIGMAVKIQNVVSALWADQPEILNQAKRAWSASTDTFSELKGLKDTLLEQGLINRHGQILPKP